MPMYLCQPVISYIGSCQGLKRFLRLGKITLSPIATALMLLYTLFDKYLTNNFEILDLAFHVQDLHQTAVANP